MCIPYLFTSYLSIRSPMLVGGAIEKPNILEAEDFLPPAQEVVARRICERDRSREQEREREGKEKK